MHRLRGASKESTLDLCLGASTRSCRGLDRRRQYGSSCRPTVRHSSVAGCARKRNAVDLLVTSWIKEIEARALAAFRCRVAVHQGEYFNKCPIMARRVGSCPCEVSSFFKAREKTVFA